MRVITTENKPIKMWLTEIEDGALDQAKNLANLPFIYRHVAIMPDSHQGYGMCIGGVIATKGVVIPNAVGVDIGCGMCAIKTSLFDISKKDLNQIVGQIKKTIPVGFSKHGKPQSDAYMPILIGETNMIGVFMKNKKNYQIPRHYDNALLSLGTLGGGNHFIEIQKGDDGFIWIMVHSGSRNLGKQIADYYNNIAKELNAKWFASVDSKNDLAFLPIDSDEGKAYIAEMNYCVDFALANRRLMMDRITDIFREVIYDNLEFSEMINIAHNYARMENHRDNVMVHRKGATSARKGEIGIIPGSQGTSSYIVEGLGNKESFESCSHGAGRSMGRAEAQRTLNLEDEIKKLDDIGVIHSMTKQEHLDEAPGSYKDIDEVMDNQKDLVKILVKLTPLAVIKG